MKSKWDKTTKNKFAIAFLSIFLLAASAVYYISRDPYIKVGELSDRLTDKPTLLRDMINKDEMLANEAYQLDQNTPYYFELKEMIDEMLRSEIYCSYNIDKHIEQISKQTGVYSYKGDTDLISLEEFKRYISFNNTYCVRALTLNPENTYYDVDKFLMWSIESEGLKIYRKR